MQVNTYVVSEFVHPRNLSLNVPSQLQQRSHGDNPPSRSVGLNGFGLHSDLGRFGFGLSHLRAFTLSQLGLARRGLCVRVHNYDRLHATFLLQNVYTLATRTRQTRSLYLGLRILNFGTTSVCRQFSSQHSGSYDSRHAWWFGLCIPQFGGCLPPSVSST